MKKKALVLAICMAVGVPVVSAAQAFPNNLAELNLGDIQSSSTLGQVFRGEIPILLSNLEDAKSLHVRLAPAHIFQKVGVEYLPFLRDLTFDIVARGNKPVIAVRSSRPVEMPFLNFVLEVSGPQGVVYQDYTILIDPQDYQNNQVNYNDGIRQNLAIQDTALQIQAQSQKKPAFDISSLKLDGPKIIKGKAIQYEVLEGDKLSEIAAALKTSQVSLKRMIDVIHRANPNAFINNDIRQLKKGVYLRIPGANDLKNFSFETVSKALNKKTKKTTHHAAQPLKTTKQSATTHSAKKAGNVITKGNTVGYIVKKGDTLSEITQKFASKDISFTKRMFAIFKANPHAFSNNKINLLKVGKVITIPYLNSIKDNTEKEFVVSKAQNKTSQVKAVEVTKATNNASDEVEFTERATEEASNSKPVGEVQNGDVNANTSKSAVDSNNLDSSLLISNLEKRVRELRKSLRESRNKLSELETVLSDKDVIIDSLKDDLREKQQEKVIEDKPKLNDSSTINEENLVANATEENIDKPVESAIQQEGTSHSKAEEPTLSLLDELSIEDSIVKNINNLSDIKGLLKNVSFNDYSLSFLALLLGLGLITYRKELYSYVAISEKKYPKFYPPEQEQIHIRTSPEEPIIDLDPEIEITTRESEDDVDELVLEECDKLIDELSVELNDQKQTSDQGNGSWDDLEKVCNDYIEKYKEPAEGDSLKASTKDHPEGELNNKVMKKGNSKAEVSQAPTDGLSFEAMVSDLLENLDEKSKFSDDETEDLKIETLSQTVNENTNSDLVDPLDAEPLHDFGILIDRNKNKNKKVSKIPEIKMDI